MPRARLARLVLTVIAAAALTVAAGAVFTPDFSTNGLALGTSLVFILAMGARIFVGRR